MIHYFKQKSHSLSDYRIKRTVSVLLGAGHRYNEDQRVRRTVNTLSKYGYFVYVYSSNSPLKITDSVENLRLISVKASFCKNTISRLIFGHLNYNIHLFSYMLKNGTDVCHCNDIDTLLAGVLLKIFSPKTHLIYDSHEDHETLSLQYKGKIFSRFVRNFENILINSFVTECITPNDYISNKFLSRGIQSTVIMNCPYFRIYDKSKKDNSESLIMVYQGSIKYDRGYDKLVEAVELLSGENLPIKILIIGDSVGIEKNCKKDIEKLVIEKNIGCFFKFKGYLQYDEMMKVVSQADVGFILFQPVPNNIGGLPNKLFENMMAGIPTIASNFPEISKVILEEHCGITVDPTNPIEIANSIKYLYKNRDECRIMGLNALRAAKEKYNFENQENKLIQIYGRLLT